MGKLKCIGKTIPLLHPSSLTPGKKPTVITIGLPVTQNTLHTKPSTHLMLMVTYPFNLNTHTDMELQVITRDPNTPIQGTENLNIIAEWCRNYQPFQDVVKKEGFELQTHPHIWMWEWLVYFKGCNSFVVFQEQPEAIYGFLYIKGTENLTKPSFKIDLDTPLTESEYEAFGSFIFNLAVRCQKGASQTKTGTNYTKPKKRKK